LAGYSDRSFRDILRNFGCELVYTEMISAEGLIRKNRQTLNLLDIHGEPPPVAVQLFGHKHESLREAARMVQDQGACAVDLNLGCPVRKVVRNGAGAALLDSFDTVIEIVRSLRKVLTIPLTVKLRSGTQHNPYAALQMAPLLESEGIDALCIHPRSKEQMFKGKADWQIIARLKERLNIPVIGNGDIRTGLDARSMIKQTSCNAVMIGRAGLGNPWIFLQAKAALGEIPQTKALYPSTNDRIQTALKYLELIVRRKGEKRGVKEFRKHAINFLKGCPFAREFRSKLYHLDSLSQTKEYLTRKDLN